MLTRSSTVMTALGLLAAGAIARAQTPQTTPDTSRTPPPVMQSPDQQGLPTARPPIDQPQAPPIEPNAPTAPTNPDQVNPPAPPNNAPPTTPNATPPATPPAPNETPTTPDTGVPPTTTTPPPPPNEAPTTPGPGGGDASSQVVVPPSPPPATSYASSAIATPALELSAGGGVADFADNASRHLTHAGGQWDVRMMFGALSPLAGELAYVGTANGVNNVMAQFAPGASIIGSSIEGDLRLQPPRMEGMPVQPYAFGGLGWNHFSLVNAQFRDPTALRSSDDTMVVPFGGGIQTFVSKRVGIDARFTYRAMFGEDLIHVSAQGVPGVSSEGMSQWTLAARVGYVF
jgi:hypothetical protein